MIETKQDLCACTNALRDWCISQSLEPCEMMMVMEFFIALMIAQNSSTEDEVTIKLHSLTTSIMKFLALVKVSNDPNR
jgi:hypothetical protein